MRKESQWVMDEHQKSLDVTSPICVSSCPTSWNTSSFCYQGYLANFSEDQSKWLWIQNYPSSPFIGMLCRPHQAYTQKLFNQFEKFMEQAPPSATVADVLRCTDVLLIAFGIALLFSYAFIAALGFCAKFLVWAAMTLVFLGNTGACAFYLYRYNNGHGGDGKDHDDLEDIRAVQCRAMFFAILTGFIAVCCLQHMRKLQDELSDAGVNIEVSCKCVLRHPSLFVLPLVTVLSRVISLSWVTFTVMNFYTAHLTEKFSEVQVMYGSRTEWSFNINIAPLHWAYIATIIFSAYWIQGVITSKNFFLMTYITQAWYFAHAGDIDDHAEHKAPCCSIFRAIWIIHRYHFGTMIFGGILMISMQPIKLVFGFLAELTKHDHNPIALILSGCCGSCIDLYKTYLEHLKREALLDVSLQGMPFLEAGHHVVKVQDEMIGIGVLNSATSLFQIAGLGSSSVFGYLTVVYILRSVPEYNNPESQMFVEHPGVLCFVGAFINLWTAFPFMMVFDVVSDAVWHSKEVVKQRRITSEKSLRGCSPTFADGFGGFFYDVASCHCGSRGISVGKAPGMQTMV